MPTETLPVIKVSDLELARNFYVNWLGFKIESESDGEEGPVELILSLKESKLNLLLVSPENNPGGMWVRIAQFDKLIPFWKMLGFKRVKFPIPPLKPARGHKNIMSMVVEDPFHNVLEFWESTAQ